MIITIKTLDNGAVVTCGKEKMGFNFDERDKEFERDMYSYIIDLIGNNGSRYDEQRIRVYLEHGDKYECKGKKCKICRGEK